MDLRTVPNPIARAGGRWLRRINDRHPWSHDDHFHGCLSDGRAQAANF